LPNFRDKQEGLLFTKGILTVELTLSTVFVGSREKILKIFGGFKSISIIGARRIFPKINHVYQGGANPFRIFPSPGKNGLRKANIKIHWAGFKLLYGEC